MQCSGYVRKHFTIYVAYLFHIWKRNVLHKELKAIHFLFSFVTIKPNKYAYNVIYTKT